MQATAELSPPPAQVAYLINPINPSPASHCEVLVHSLERRIENLVDRFYIIQHRLRRLEDRNIAIKQSLVGLHARLKKL